MFLNPDRVVQQLGLLPGMVVIDVGSGIGNFSRAIVQHIGTSGHVYALDILPDVVQRLRNDCRESGITNVTALVADIEHIDGVSLVHESADIILLSNVLFQCADKLRVLSEITRLLKPNGRVYIIEWSDSFHGLGPIADHVIPAETLKSLCATSGLDYQGDLGNVGSHHYGMIFKKFS